MTMTVFDLDEFTPAMTRCVQIGLFHRERAGTTKRGDGTPAHPAFYTSGIQEVHVS